MDSLVALAPEDLIKVKGVKNWLGDTPRRVTVGMADGWRFSSIWDMRSLLEKVGIERRA
jgi:hypothetical protein